MSLDAARLLSLLDGFSQARLLVLGDLVLDEYVNGDVDRVSPEAPVPVVQVSGESRALGGAGNVARNVAALGGRARLCAVRGDDAAGAACGELLAALGLPAADLVTVGSRPTTRKTRVVARGQQIVRFDRERCDALAPAEEDALVAAVAAALPECDAVVVADYGKGALSPRVAAEVMRRCRDASVPVTLDPKANLAGWEGAALVKPNLREAEALARIRVDGPEALARVAAELRRELGGADVVVTRGSEGLSLFDATGERIDVPTLAQAVFDVQGAGDTVSAVLAMARHAGAGLVEAAVLANAAAGVVVGKLGTATADRDEVRALLPQALAAAGGRG